MRLQRDTVIATALGLLDEAGLDGLTMRRLAQALKVQAPSLYWHFPSKEALIDAMADALLTGVAATPPDGAEATPPDGTEGWRDTVRRIAGDLRRALGRHRDGGRVYAGTYVVTDNTLRVSQSLITALCAGGAGPRTAAWGAFTLLHYVLGFTIEEQGLPATAGEAGATLAELRARFEDAAAARFPRLLPVVPDIFDMDQEARFAFGLEVLVAGLGAVIAGEAARTPPPVP